MNDTCAAAGYQIGTICWPDGWEPEGPLDVPNCILSATTAASAQPLAYRQAESIVHALNRQCIDSPGTIWYVVVAEDAGPVLQASDGQQTTVTVDPCRIVRPDRGTTGDCSCCPAHNLPCTKGE